MKEATGEASMTGITIAIIAVIAVIAIPIVQMLVRNTRNSSCCASQGGFYEGGECYSNEAKTDKINNWQSLCNDNQNNNNNNN